MPRLSRLRFAVVKPAGSLPPLPPGASTSPPTDNCPQPKEALPLSQLEIRKIKHFDSSAL
jgi:hypothetical protein